MNAVRFINKNASPRPASIAIVKVLFDMLDCGIASSSDCGEVVVSAVVDGSWRSSALNLRDKRLICFVAEINHEKRKR